MAAENQRAPTKDREKAMMPEVSRSSRCRLTGGGAYLDEPVQSTLAMDGDADVLIDEKEITGLEKH